MSAATTTPGDTPGPDPVASLTLAVVAAVALAASWILPWWVMAANAPQYGQRTLVVQVGPRGPFGDVTEVDMLGHYVGIQPMQGFAVLERKLAPFGLVAAIAGLLGMAFIPRRRWRLVALLPALAMPAIFLLDLHYWTERSVTERDPDASLNLTIGDIDTKLFGAYEIGQFKVRATAGDGLRLSILAALLGSGLAFSRPLRLRRRGRSVTVEVGAKAVAGLLVVFSAGAEAAQWQVATAAELSQALRDGGDGDVVELAPGVFRGHFTIAHALRLHGPREAVLDGGGEGTVLVVKADGVQLKGFTVRAGGANYNREDAAIRLEGKQASLSGLRLEDTLFGIFALQADGCVVEQTEILGKDLPPPRRGDGIRLWYSSGCRLTRNTLERSRDLVIWYSSDTLVEENEVRHSRYGLHYMYSDRNRFRRNRFEDNEVGAAIMNSKEITLEENAFSFSTGPAAYGLLVKDADNVFVRGNRFVHNSTGIFFDGAPQSRGGRVEVQGNLLARNDVGLVLQPSSRGLALWENAFIGNGEPVQVQGSGGDPTANTWAVGGRGNYWSEAVVYDRDRDGVSELPYRAESHYEALTGRYPELAFFAHSPGAEAIDLASRLFPIFAPRPRMEDPAPLTAPPLSDWTRAKPAVRGAALPLASAGLLAAVVMAAAVLRRSAS